MGNCASSRKAPRAEPEMSPMLAKIRAAQQRFLDQIIEGEISDSESETRSDHDDDDDFDDDDENPLVSGDEALRDKMRGDGKTDDENKDNDDVDGGAKDSSRKSDVFSDEKEDAGDDSEEETSDLAGKPLLKDSHKQPETLILKRLGKRSPSKDTDKESEEGDGTDRKARFKILSDFSDIPESPPESACSSYTDHVDLLIQEAELNPDKSIRFKRRGRFFSVMDRVDKKARDIDPREYDYPFENIVLEGGGNKGIAYCGAIRVLEELGLWAKVKRIAGASAGAMTAALLAVGYSSYDLQTFLSDDLSKIFLDHKCGYCSLLPNILTGFGWNPGKRIFNKFGDMLSKQCGNADITFRDLWNSEEPRFKKELCIVVTNLNQMSTEYCHVKTTPDMPIRVAVRMSMAIPGLFQATTYTNHSQTDVFVDGGVLCNYPIHCFDGWWLSMEDKHSFLKKLQPLDRLPYLLAKNERFGPKPNEKTLGFLLFADDERELLRYQVEAMRRGTQLSVLPNTKLAKEKLRKKQLKDNTDREHRRVVRAVNTFLHVLEKHNLDGNHTISHSELEAALKDEEFTPNRRRRLFGDLDSDTILQYLDRDGNGQISYQELVHFMEETGINVQVRFQGYQRREVKNFFTFLDTLQSTLLTNVKKIYVEESDIQRTVGINTGHVDTSDFQLEPADIEFLVERGRQACVAFLKYYAVWKELDKKPSKNGDVVSTAAKTDVTGTEKTDDAGGDVTARLSAGAGSVVEVILEGPSGSGEPVKLLSVNPLVDDKAEGSVTDGEVFETTKDDSALIKKENGS